MSCFLSRFWIPKPWRSTRLPPVSPLPFPILSSLVHSWELEALGGQWYWWWQHSAPGRQYRAIHSTEQQHAYEQDFETDYAEYRVLHARVGAASQRFIELAAEMNSVQRGTPEHKVRRTGWTQAGFQVLLAINSLLIAHKYVCSMTKVTSKSVLREKLSLHN